jgi:predicted Fe-S protein YdhL (DUF1289 family)
MKQDSPCIAVCVIDPASQLCLGCGRTLPEIARWHRLTRSERLTIMASLPARMAEAGLPPPSASAN